MTNDLFWLAATVLTTGLFAFPYVIHRSARLGPARAFGNPAPGDDATMADWAQRAKRAHLNSVENLILFAPSVLAVHAAGLSSTLTVAACLVYCMARIVHYAVYAAGIPVARTLAHFVSLIAVAALLLRLFGLL